MGGLVSRLSFDTGMTDSLVRRIIETAPVRYKEYTINKRNGGKRLISQPAREVKILQRSLVDILLKKLPIHEAAMAYIEGLSIRDNAARHAGRGPILKMDFEDFFHSIKKKDWVEYCQRTKCVEDEEDISLTSSLLFHKSKIYSGLRLAIGAPSSPMVSNILMYEFDKRISEAVAPERVSYSRYADDITFSAPRTGYLVNVQKAVKATIRAISNPKLEINEEKTTYVTSKYRRSVTGLILTNDGKVSIGHEKKRTIRAAVHRALNNRMDKSELIELSGMMAFVNSVEPEFLLALKAKYGEKNLEKVQRICCDLCITES